MITDDTMTAWEILFDAFPFPAATVGELRGAIAAGPTDPPCAPASSPRFVAAWHPMRLRDTRRSPRYWSLSALLEPDGISEPLAVDLDQRGQGALVLHLDLDAALAG